MNVIEGQEKSVYIEMKINNEQRAFGATLSHIISKYEQLDLFCNDWHFSTGLCVY